ncbi:MAG: glycoside hydrolase 100 family protein [archaeon]
MKKDILEEAYEKAIETLKLCFTKNGLYASGGEKGYKGVWSRDSNISLIGASTDKSEEFKGVFKKSLETLKKNQSELGQIPNAVLHFERKKPQVDFKSIDSSLWFIIGHYVYKQRYKDVGLFNKHKKAIENAIKWISYRDFGEDVTLEQLPTSDWQDAFPDKYGTVVSTQALYYIVLELVKNKKKIKKLKKVVNDNPEDRLWEGNFYWAYRWKNHNKYKEIGEWFDSFGNILCIISGLADKKKSKKILNYIKKNKIAKPYPVKSIYPPITKNSEYWQNYYLDAGATPNHYLNGGIWPFIGGFYVLALIKMKMFKQAEKELELLAKSNLENNLFPEWIDPITKETHGKLQAWSAGTYMWAYNSLKKKKVL